MNWGRHIGGANIAAALSLLLTDRLSGRAYGSTETPEQREARILKQRTVIDADEFHRREAAERAAAEYEAKAAPIREERRRRKALAYARRLPKSVCAAALAALAKGQE